MKNLFLILLITTLFLSCGVDDADKFISDGDLTMNMTATIETNKGVIEVGMYGHIAPTTVYSFVNLASRGYFDGITYHRVVPGFVIQGGDPTGTGSGGPGYQFGLEVDRKLKHDAAGVLSMARTNNPNSNGSQYFITLAPTPNLDMQYTVFGRVTKGLDVVMAITKGDRMAKVTIQGELSEEMKTIQSKIDKWNEVLTEKFPNLGPVVFKAN